LAKLNSLLEIRDVPWVQKRWERLLEKRRDKCVKVVVRVGVHSDYHLGFSKLENKAKKKTKTFWPSF